MAREEKIKDRKFLVISEDLKSFPDYFGIILKEFRFGQDKKFDIKLDKKCKGCKGFFKVRTKYHERIIVNIKHIIDPKNSVETAKIHHKKFEKIYCVFDKSKNDKNYEKALNLIGKAKNIIIIDSSPSYEFWLLLHFIKSDAEYRNYEELEKRLVEVVRSKTKNKKFEYSKSKLPKEISDLVIDKLSYAISNAKGIEESNKITNSDSFTKIYQLIEDFQKYSN